MKRRFYIVNFTDASLSQTDDMARAYSIAQSDEMFVIDTEVGARLNPDSTITRAFDCDSQKETT
jgi:hypothetical protein